MRREDVQVNLRLPAELVVGLREAASRNGVSLTAEIAHRLDESFPRTTEAITEKYMLGLLSELHAARETMLDLRRRFAALGDDAKVAECDAHLADIDAGLRKIRKDQALLERDATGEGRTPARKAVHKTKR